MAEVENSAPLLEMRGVEKSFGATRALAGVDLVVRPAEVHALVGENGAGKSTLMKVLSGAIASDRGTMSLLGRDYRPAGPLDARRAGVSMIYQELSLAPHLSVEENINLGLEPSNSGFVKRSEARRRAKDALSRLGHPEIRPEWKTGRLTVAMQQIVEIARALSIGSRVLVLDEPTSSLPQDDVERLFEVVKRLRDEGRAIVYISHFIEEVIAIADRFTVLRDGAVAGGGDISDTDSHRIVSLMVGREVTELYKRSAREAGEVVLEVRGLAGKKKPSSASLSLRRGEVLGIAGLVGAGRTELLRAIFGLDPVKGGEIKVGAYFGPASPGRRWVQGVGMVSEDRKGEGLALSMSLSDNLTMSSLRGLGPSFLLLPGKQDRAAMKWINKLDIRCRGPRQRMQDLSGGNQQKAAIARLLHHDVDVFLLDEPTRGIDVASKAGVYQLIDELVTGDAGGEKRAVLLVSSYLPELLGVCDRVAVMCRGVLGDARACDGLDEKCLMMEATGQEAT